jgi:putative sigma-54 modulation protein
LATATTLVGTTGILIAIRQLPMAKFRAAPFTRFLKKLAIEYSQEQRHLVFMKLILSTHNVTLTDAIEKHVLAKVDKLDRLTSRVLHARVILEHDHMRVPERRFCCSMRLGVSGPDLFAEDRESDLYAAIDLVVKKIEQQIRKRQSKVKARKHKIAARTKRTRQEEAL